jgi:hypothetical protein
MGSQDWYIELYDADSSKPKHTEYVSDTHKALTLVKTQREQGDIVRVVAPPSATELDMQILKELGAISD